MLKQFEMTKYFVLLLGLLASNLIAQTDSEWLRYSSISPDGKTIAFSYKGDIFTVPSAGGMATAITYHSEHEYMPVWSHDGKHIAFASNRHGNMDVFIVSSNGGEAKRLTFHTYNQYPNCFSRDNKAVIFTGLMIDDASHRQYPHRSQHEVYSVPVEGGRISQVWTIPGDDIKISKDGNTYVYHDKPGGENEFRKHHTSSVARDLWTYDKNTKQHVKLTNFKGEDRNPVFSTDEKSLYYLSEKSGTFNVHKRLLDNSVGSEQITTFEKHPVRFLSSSNDGLLCFGYHGSLYTMKDNEEPQKISVIINTGLKNNNMEIVRVGGNAEEFDISADGKEVVYTVRGEVFVSGVENGMTKRITNTPEQEAFVSFSPDGKSIMYASERNSRWSVYETKRKREEEAYFFASTILEEKMILGGDGEYYQPSYSPDGKEIAYIKNRRQLEIYNIATKAKRTLLTPEDLFYMGDGDQYFTWSLDSKWLLAEWSPVLHNGEILLLSADGKKRMNLTESGYYDSRPIWTNEGKQMLWFSDRDGLRSYAKSGMTERDVYTMFFTQEAFDKFNMSEEDYKLWKELEEKKKKKEKEAKKEDEKSKKKKKKDEKKDKKEDVKALVFDFDGLEDRKKRLTIHSSKLNDAVLSKDGEKLFYLARFEKGVNLWSTNLRTKETKMELKLGARFASLKWNKKGDKLFLLSNGSISKIDPKSMKKESIKMNGEVSINLEEERTHVFDHVWNRTGEMFYTSDMHGIDWKEMREEYEPKLASIANDFELTEILSEMIGELNVSHAGARYRHSVKNADQTASLGIFPDYSYTGNGIRIAEVMKGGPLDKKNLAISTGMIIEEIDGIVLTPSVNYFELLNRKAGKFMSIKVKTLNGPSEYKTVKPIDARAEYMLLYKRWVKKNQEEVERLSNGTLAYVHVPGMSDGPYRTVFEDVMGKYVNAKALILDTRFNGGGDLVSDLSMFLTGEKYLDYAIESRSVGYEPTFRWTKPSIAIVNENNYSDGHCFAFAYKELEIGKMLGMPVPGTCSFAGWEMQQNGTIIYGAVPVSARDMDGNWMENYQTEPDILIKNDPNVIITGKDQQLERAIQELMK